MTEGTDEAEVTTAKVLDQPSNLVRISLGSGVEILLVSPYTEMGVLIAEAERIAGNISRRASSSLMNEYK